jgi:ATP-dependent exoDNAse (exonuclease V) beta subunit
VRCRVYAAFAKPPPLMTITGRRRAMPAERPMDYAQRLAALDPVQSFLCEAPAGSGKTELLSQRFLTLLGGVTRPEELLAITFTRKATAAMRDRIIGALRLAAREPEPEDDYRRITWRAARSALAANDKYDWNLLHNPGRLQIRTFDSLCAQLTAALPLHSTFGAPPAVMEEPEALYRRAIRQLFADLEQDVNWADALLIVLSHLDNNFQTLEELCVRLLRRREEWLPLIDHGAPRDVIRTRLEHPLQHVNDEVIARLQRLIPAPLQRRLVDVAAYAAMNLRRFGEDTPILHCLDLDTDAGGLPDSGAAGIRQWSGLLALLTTETGQWRAAVDKRVGFPAGAAPAEKALCRERKEQMLALIADLRQIDGLLEALRDLRNTPSVRYTEGQLEILEALSELLPVLVAYLTLAFSERNCVDFTELNIRARRALGGPEAPSDLALALDYRIRHILVDEFQDVSAAQVALLRQLTAGWQAGDGHTLFCVGDAMQSIYGFRDANVGLFIHCAEHGLGNVPLTGIRLGTNFRSHGGLVGWINAVFAPAFPARNDIASGAVQYVPAVAFQRAGPDAPVQVLGFTGAAEADEARAILEIIRGLRRETPAASIAILVHTRKHAVHILPLLKASGMRYRAVDLEPLAEHMIIQDLLSLLRALLHPADRIAWLSVLRAPWCGLTLADLLAIAEAGGAGAARTLTVMEQMQICLTAAPALPARLTEDGQARLARVAPVLLTAVATQGRKPLRQWVEGAWLELGGPACLADPAELDHAERFFALLESLDNGGVAPEVESIHNALAELYAAPDPSADDALQVMTIHKAKGLEFDAVIIPSMHRVPRRTAPELILWQERLTTAGDRELIMAPIPGPGGRPDRIYAFLQEEQRKKEAYERCRLLYVACTRARQKLFLLTRVNRDADSSALQAPAKSSLLHAIWDSVRSEVRLVGDGTGTAAARPAAPVIRLLRRLPSGWRLPPLPERDVLSACHSAADRTAVLGGDGDAGEMAEDNFTAARQDPVARHVGTVVHEALQEIGRQGLAAWLGDGVERYRPYWRARLATLGVAFANVDHALDATQAALQAVLRDPNCQWLFSETHARRCCEYAVSLASRGPHRNLVIDLLLQERTGATWIIDYKISRPGPGEDDAAFIERQKLRYAPKLELYRRAIAQLGFQRVRTALYFPLLGKLIKDVTA